MNSAEKIRPRPTSAAKTRALRLRKNETYGERVVWQALRALKMNFRRQAPVGSYVVDFAHFASGLIIDGFHHSLPERQERDAERDGWFRREGFRVLRIAEPDVRADLQAVIARIVAEIPPTPTRPSARGKGADRYDVR
ncbi:endonuclease domain-containing protein [Brevundimonas sp.]|uniref:endonuclease domain-containing protein n=1 Tax=Brevundimonas sp. TaxID=1871086 RepID=UPI003515A34D